MFLYYKMKLFKSNTRQLLMLSILAILAWFLYDRCMKKSFYQGSPIEIAPKTTKTIFDGEVSDKGIPGSGDNECYYTVGLLPKCKRGVQQTVSDLASYAIKSGIGMDI